MAVSSTTQIREILSSDMYSPTLPDRLGEQTKEKSRNTVSKTVMFWIISGEKRKISKPSEQRRKKEVDNT